MINTCLTWLNPPSFSILVLPPPADLKSYKCTSYNGVFNLNVKTFVAVELLRHHRLIQTTFRVSPPFPEIKQFLAVGMALRESLPSSTQPGDESHNAQSQPITVTSGPTTYGVLNQLPSGNMTYRIGIQAAQGIRSTMEDTHAFVVDFDSVHGQGYFAVFDGHGNKNVSEWCGANFHKVLLETIHGSTNSSPNDIMKDAFRRADEQLEKVSEDNAEWCDSGSTAVVAFLRYEDEEGSQKAFETCSIKRIPESLGSSISIPGAGLLKEPPPGARRVLYCANAGDARAVMCRNGVATRLTQDHKASDEDEKKRIRQAGGIVLRGRVLGALAVSRSLGDHVRYEGLRLKDYVIGTPYTSRTELKEDDEFCIIACDGLWDVVTDQHAVEMIRYQDDVQKASETLVNFALQNEYLLSRDNVTVMVVRFRSAPKAS